MKQEGSTARRKPNNRLWVGIIINTEIFHYPDERWKEVWIRKKKKT